MTCRRWIPCAILWHRTRQWLVYSHFRLLFAGFYPVEFRDFFLGDLYCSLTYATCNIELFFCLYAHQWNQPPQCNSSHSRLLGFFYALPAIWRALQCIRRYRDTKNVFPHLVNCGKYGMTIMQAVTLSLYRIEGTITHLVLFIIFSALTGVYTSIWDLFMDFSLLQPDAREPFLRDILGLKRRWPYYAIMIVDPLLRFTWIFYAIFTYDREHSTFVSFLVAFGEVTRRGMWTLFRVENEHCSNVAQYKASRDLPLPYRLEHEPLMEHPGGPGEDDEESAETAVATASSVGVDAAGASARLREGNSSSAARAAAARTSASAAERGEGGPGSHPHVHTARPQAELYRTRSIRGLIALAHTQDFEKKRRPPPAERSTGVGGVGGDASADEAKSDDDEDDDDDDLEEEEDDEDETSSMVEDRMEVRHAESLVRGDRSVHGDG
ncbi:EXS family-domain-containing protein [Xylariaceae sp. FL0804]|nr:EXS family-domain-containing protein [Xylariaceae sp. FL0804]